MESSELLRDVATLGELEERLPELPGLGYVTDVDGRIVAYNQSEWDAFAIEGEAPELAERENVIDHSVYDSIADAENRLAYAGFTELLATDKRPQVVFHYRCDAPRVGRKMMMQMFPVRLPEGEVFIVYHSRLLEEVRDQLVPIMARQSRRVADLSLPMIKICSYCQHLMVPHVCGDGIWISAKDYYEAGGTNDVRVSHGICPECNAAVVEPQLALLESN